MDAIAIKVENLSKRYRIGLKEQMHVTLGGALMSWIKSPISNFKSLRRLSHFDENGDAEDVIWALKDVSFEVKQGEVVGVIGRNGAGKSTLLKVLSRITEPTSGRAVVRGRVSSLLEVGTGFHQDLTGRENVYLNGTILGMSKQEIDRKFDEIVAFAEVDRFIDTPVKRYSSGMQVRLAFAVAAHLEPEILLVDEVLAVGDAAFQKKCVEKMGKVAKEGRTVLFVSHNMQAIARLCTRAMLLETGRINGVGATPEIVASYLHSGHGLLAERTWDSLDAAPGNDVVRLTAVRARSESGSVQQVFNSRHSIGIDVGYTVTIPVKNLVAEVVLYNEEGTLLFASANQYDDRWLSSLQRGHYLSTCWIPGNLMTEGTFFVRVSIVEIRVPIRKHVYERDIIVFQVVDTMDGDSARGRVAHNYPGVIRPKLEWNTEFLGYGKKAKQ